MLLFNKTLFQSIGVPELATDLKLKAKGFNFDIAII